MKNIFQIKSLFKLGVFTLGLLLLASCEDDSAEFNFQVLPSYHDGIQNLDETGVDCGGGSGVACPSCTDGIQNQGEEGVDCGGPCSSKCADATPRADELATGGLPYYYTFESGEPQSGKVITPRSSNPDGSAYSQGVTISYGASDPAGSDDAVGFVVRPENGPFGGFEDFKFQFSNQPIDFSVYHKFTLDVYIPSSNNFSGSLQPKVELILHDNVDGNFWQRWTIITVTVDESDFDSWVTLKFDGENAAAADTGILLPVSNNYDNITLRFGGDGHQERGEFYIKDFKPTTSFVAPGTPRADALSSSGLPRYFTFEAADASSGLNLEPRTVNSDGSAYGQGVDVTYGVADPAGSDDGVARVYRPDDGRFGGFEDFKFQFQDMPIDFSEYFKFKIDVYIPSGQDFSGALTPTVELILHDDNPNFFERWTIISQTVTEFDTWVTLEFDGINAAAAGSGTLLPSNGTYDTFTLRFGGSGHTVAGEFFVKDFVPFQ
ncbi:hypothetical protein [Aquimarina sp. MMG016]|uniref:hypothetical protein n=1 Tax=Aquimarina sp. MMG016 TaxID=2822690 RepID=UPI001B39F3B7|nr:hypothetical protein [Aquimarina sp. MMG016]MBQ4818564.1 hypothetical protein [Aquimarina sp. MMG016]